MRKRGNKKETRKIARIFAHSAGSFYKIFSVPMRFDFGKTPAYLQELTIMSVHSIV